MSAEPEASAQTDEAQADDVCPAENTAKDGSPGLIEGAEELLWVILDPETKSEWEMSATKFSKKRLKEASFSVVRREHTNADEIAERVIQPKTAGGKQTFHGIALILADDVRSIKDHKTDVRLVCAFDDPLPEFSAHALLGYSLHVKQPDYWSKQNNQAAVIGNLMLAFRKNGGPHALQDLFPEAG